MKKFYVLIGVFVFSILGILILEGWLSMPIEELTIEKNPRIIPFSICVGVCGIHLILELFKKINSESVWLKPYVHRNIQLILLCSVMVIVGVFILIKNLVCGFFLWPLSISIIWLIESIVLAIYSRRLKCKKSKGVV